MPQPPVDPTLHKPGAPATGRPDAVSPWLVVPGSVVLAVHLFLVGVVTVAAPSGPWPTAMGANLATPPQFAFELDQALTPIYLSQLKMAHNYHYPSNRPGTPGTYFQVRLKDADGKVIETVRFPDPNASCAVRHRQELLARGLVDDQMVQPPQAENVAAPNRRVPMVQMWDIPEGARELKLRTIPEHLIPRDRPVMRPSDWAQLLARSYARHLCRKHGAAAAEIVRHTRDPIPPFVLYMEPQAGMFDDLVANFGELPR